MSRRSVAADSEADGPPHGASVQVGRVSAVAATTTDPCQHYRITLRVKITRTAPEQNNISPTTSRP
ncbi:hypothetical protein BH11ARM1_BH11ARM1_18340 [soil metagenome]